MNSPVCEGVAGHPGGPVAEREAHAETTLASAYSPVDYMSITSFPRLPEEDALSGDNAAKSRKDDDNILSEQETGKGTTVCLAERINRRSPAVVAAPPRRFCLFRWPRNLARESRSYFCSGPRPGSVSEVGAPSASPVLRLRPGRQRPGFSARDD